LDQKYPAKEDKERVDVIHTYCKDEIRFPNGRKEVLIRNYEGGELDLSDFTNLKNQVTRRLFN
jgi:hypothetical protein